MPTRTLRPRPSPRDPYGDGMGPSRERLEIALFVILTGALGLLHHLGWL